MSNYAISYSPYRSSFKQERMRDILGKKEKAAASAEVVKIKVTPFTLMTALFVITVLLSSLYLLNFNKVATKGYILKRLEISRQELQQQNDLRTLSLADAKAMSQIIDSGAVDHMRRPGSVEYVFGDSVLAKAD
jgi:hypothetical protein